MTILPFGDCTPPAAASESQRVRVVVKGPLGAGARIDLIDGDRVTPVENVTRVEVDPITPDGLVQARLTVLVDELDVQAEVDRSTPAPASVAAALAVDVARLEVRPGDCVVVTMRESLTPKQRAALRAEVSQVVPNGARILVLDGGMGLAVLAPHQIPAGQVEPV